MRRPLILGLSLLLLAVAASAVGQETRLLVITGVEGDAEHGDQFHKWATAVIDAATRRGAIPDSNVTYLADKPERDPMRIKARSTREHVTRAFGDLAAQTRPSDEVLVFLFGHGSFDGHQAAFNLPGPDLTAQDYADLLGRIRSARIAFVNTSSSSGEFAKVLAGPGRTIITATRSGGERNEPRFPAFFVEGLTSDTADRNRDGRISLQEAFDYARNRVQQVFEKEGFLISEHAMLEEAQAGAAATLFLASDRAKPSAIAVTADPALRAALEEKQSLEDQVASLRLRKSSMPAEEYERDLEKLLTALALKTRAARQLEGSK